MNSISEYALADIFPISLSGEWGSEPVPEGNALVLRAADFTKDCKLRGQIGALRKINQLKLDRLSLQKGDILIEKSGGSPDQPVGRVVFFDREDEGIKYVPSNFLQLLRVADGFDKKFSYYLMTFLYYCGFVYRYQQQTTGIINLKLENYFSTKVAIPSRLVQERIQEILSTIDRAIAHTEALIEKYHQIKAGLMHDLFTRGIGADGKLRPTREEAPELYQESAIGWIPREWDCVNLRQVADLEVGFPFKSDWFQEDGIKLLRGENVGYGQPDWKDTQCLSYEKSENFKEYLLREGDIIIGMDRTFTKSGIKITVLQVFDCPSLLVQRVGRFVAFGCHKSYLRWILLSDQYLCALMNQQKGMDIPHLSKAGILEPLIPIPPETEQIDIVRCIEACEYKIQKECEILEKLARQKTGLMHDLLTGKVPVKVDPDEVAHVLN
ncbi:MAG: restriction endonuclease subunit S [Coleofasciculus sp. D1-CHI-01]|uniref:restriction endonuclease subunit S n=1 Tax=Coleofasciculus sp. D1-CHI-01 TaxID=3068482 RepID=UPI0032F84AD6